MIHPRRLKGSPGNIAKYFTIGDYYTKGGDEPSAWGGAIADDLGLVGKVDPAMFEQLLAGRVGEQQLGRHRKDGTIEHHPGWDFAVNAPKSVSIMALVMGDERILEAHEKAVGAAIAYLEDHAELRRRDNGEIVHETTGRLLYARFTEHASRELDPHLHTHVVVMNMTNRESGDTLASLETRAMFVEQMTAGQVYRNELAHGLREAGYAIDYNPRNGLFEIQGVPGALIMAMSQRAEQIDAHAQEHGLQGQAARRRSFYVTRRAKETVAPDELRKRWTQRTLPHREKLEKVRTTADARGERSLTAEPAVAARAMLFGLRQTEGHEAVNNQGLLFRTGLASHVGEVRLSDLRPLAEDHQRRAKLLRTTEQTGDPLLIRGRTTRRSAHRELGFVYHLALAIGDAQPVSSEQRIDAVLASAGLYPAQEHALRFIGLSSDRLVGVHGVAGAGKSTLVKALTQAAEPGTTFLALAPTSSAAANLGKGAEIESRTAASLIAGGGRGIDSAHVLVVDEAGQLGNRQAQRLLEISRLTGARLIFIGDNKQTGAIEQGKAFWLLQRLGLPTAQMNESVRQETNSLKAAVTQARAGDYAGSIAALDRVAAGPNARKLAESLVGEWARLAPSSRAKTNILVLENATRLIVNDLVRSALQVEGAVAEKEASFEILSPSGMTEEEKRFARFYSKGQVLLFARDRPREGIFGGSEYRVAAIQQGRAGRQVVRLIDEQGGELQWDPRIGRPARVNVFKSEHRDLAVGDRIQWRLVNHELGIKNAERGVVEEINGSEAAVRWDRGGRLQTIDLGRHKTWDHGYAETVYSAQSKTFDRVYVIAPVNSPLVNGQNYYTAITRARFGVKLWTEDPRRLIERLENNSGEKSSSLEGLGRLTRDGLPVRPAANDARLEQWRDEMRLARAVRARQGERRSARPPTGVARLAEGAREIAERLARLLSHDRARDQDRSSEPPRTSGGIDR
jgi:conjugative relaxase-like TrwC/TraI family protein